MAGYTSSYSWEDFLKELEESGLQGQFSNADMELAHSNPSAGRSILSYKKDYNSATNDQARALANAGAERVRSSFGGYTAGNDGSQYYRDSLSPRDFTYADAPTFSSRYDSQIQSLLSGLVNRDKFSYDVENDPLYSQYRKQYIREGQRASQNAMGQAAAMSGGLPSSYAGTAAGQAANYYNAQLTDKIPELEQLAYQKYLNDFDMDRTKLQAVQDADNVDYQRYLGQLSQYNTDRDFAYGQFTDEVANQRQNREDLWTRAETAAQYGDFKGLNDLGVDTSAYQSQQERARALEDALLRAQYQDYSGLNGLGVDTAAYQRQLDRDRAIQEAELYAQYGDLSGLQALGVDTSAYERQLAAQSGSRSSGSGANISATSGGSYLQLMESAGVSSRAEAFDFMYQLTGDRLVAQQYAEYWAQNRKNTTEKGIVGAVAAGEDLTSAVAQSVAGGVKNYLKRAKSGLTDVLKGNKTADAAGGPDQLTGKARSLYNQIESKRGGLTMEQVRQTILDAYDRGDLTDEEALILHNLYSVN